MKEANLQQEIEVNESLVKELSISMKESEELTLAYESLLKVNEELISEKDELYAKNVKLEKEIQKLVAQERKKEEERKKTASAKSTTKKQTTVNTGGWKTMTVNASAYTLVEHGDKLGGSGLTSIGKVPTANRTIAVDPKVIPYGSLIKYNGVTYVAEDTGGMIKGNKVDIFMNTLDEAVRFGRKDISIQVQFSK